MIWLVVVAILMAAGIVAFAVAELAGAVSHVAEPLRQATEAVREAAETIERACSQSDPFDEGAEPTARDVLDRNLSNIEARLGAIEQALITGFRQAPLRQAAFRQARLREKHPDWTVPVTPTG
jgi:hypothetical protein